MHRYLIRMQIAEALITVVIYNININDGYQLAYRRVFRLKVRKLYSSVNRRCPFVNKRRHGVCTKRMKTTRYIHMREREALITVQQE